MSIGPHVTPPVSQTHGLPQVTIKQKKNHCLLYKFVYYTSLIQNFHKAKQNKPILKRIHSHSSGYVTLNKGKLTKRL